MGSGIASSLDPMRPFLSTIRAGWGTWDSCISCYSTLSINFHYDCLSCCNDGGSIWRLWIKGKQLCSTEDQGHKLGWEILRIVGTDFFTSSHAKSCSLTHYNSNELRGAEMKEGSCVSQFTYLLPFKWTGLQFALSPKIIPYELH